MPLTIADIVAVPYPQIVRNMRVPSQQVLRVFENLGLIENVGRIEQNFPDEWIDDGSDEIKD